MKEKQEEGRACQPVMARQVSSSPPGSSDIPSSVEKRSLEAAGSRFLLGQVLPMWDSSR